MENLQTEVMLNRPPLQSKETPTLKKMIKEDELLQDFFKLIHDHQLRAEAHKLLQERLGG